MKNLNSSKTKLKNIVSLPHTPPYKIHRYFARRPWNVFSNIIKTYTNKGDLILDPFMGGGVTIYEGLKLNRKVIGFDLNPLSHFIVSSMIQTNLDIKLVDKYYKNIIKIFSSKIKFDTKEDYNDLLWREMTYEVQCNYCKSKTLISNKSKVGIAKYKCNNLKCRSHKNPDSFVIPKNCKRLGKVYLYSVKKDKSGKNVQTPINEKELKKINLKVDFLIKSFGIKKDLLKTNKIPKNWDRQKEDLLEEKGFINFEDFFTPTNLVLNIGLKKIIKNLKMPKNYNYFFRLVFSSSLRDTNVMSYTNDRWQSGKPITWSRHAYWVPSQFCEVNVLEAFNRAFKRSREAILYSFQNQLKCSPKNKWKEGNQATIINNCISESNLKDNLVDAIITDPPYGSNVQYLELSHFWLPWNKDIYQINSPNYMKEAVSNRKENFIGAKSLIEYEENLHSVFIKSYKLLKPGGVLAITFNNKDMGAWLALLFSIFKCGFVIDPADIYFQDGVKNYKQTSHTRAEGSIYGDFIYIFKKPLTKNLIKNKLTIKQFKLKMDKIFLSNKNVSSNKYFNQLKCFEKSISYIQSISCATFTKEEKKLIYKHFNKKYLEVFFEKNK